MDRGILFCCVAAALFSLALSMCSTDYMRDDEKIHHHLSELRRSLYDLNHRRIHKRSASPNYNEIIFRSLSSFCSQLSISENSNSTTGIPTTSITPARPDHSYEVHGPRDSVFASGWSGPDVFPYAIRVERPGDRISIIFQLIHSGPATVFQLNPFDFKNISVGYPQADDTRGFVESSVRVEVDASMCHNVSGQEEDSISYAFGIQDSSRYRAFTALDLCTYGRPRNKDRNSWTQDGNDFTQIVPQPPFLLAPSLGDEITIQQDNPMISLNLKVHLCLACEMSVNVMLWDKEQKKFNTSTVKMTMTHPAGPAGIRLVYPQAGNLESRPMLKASVLQEIKMEPNDKDAIKENSETVRGLVALEIDAGERTGGGKIDLAYSWRDPDQSRRPLVRVFRTTRSILLRHKDNRNALPRNTVEITTNGPLQCAKMGTRSAPKRNRNCTLTCHAHGSNIKDIKIKKMSSSRRPMRAASYILGNSTATAVLDLGPTSRRLEGKYKCVVQTSNGQRTRKEFQLYTLSGFTEIEEFSVREFTSNRTTRIACVAKGENPMGVAFSLSFKNGTFLKLFDSALPRWSFSYASGKHLLIYMVDTDMVREPGVYLTCTANGSRGVDIRETAMEPHIYRYKDQVPTIDKASNSTFAWRHHNGTVVLQCSALSSRPIEMSISQVGSRRIDNLTENTRSVSQFGIRKTLMVTSPSGNIPLGSIFDCRAVDDRGSSSNFVFRLEN